MLDRPISLRKTWVLLFPAVVLAILLTQTPAPPAARGQDAVSPGADPAGPAPFTGDEEEVAVAPPAERPAPASRDEINLLSLLVRGGGFMIPLGLLSIIVVTFAIERGLGLRRERVIPQSLITGLGRASSPTGFDPRKAYRLCQEYPSATANVIRSMLLKVGRPHSEVEHTVAEAGQREADRMYANVRWLTMSAGVAPLIGLLGTVWGMIVAFHDTTRLAPGQNKADFLANGIYVALVTTLAGLCIAIPAAIIAHYYEGRIQKLFHEIDELMFNLLPQIERYEGRVRFSRPQGEGDEAAMPTGPSPTAASTATPPPPPAPARRPAPAPAPK
jgi:biopolymer transport protein ExbB